MTQDDDYNYMIAHIFSSVLLNKYKHVIKCILLLTI
jgi:hypothetical protein